MKVLLQSNCPYHPSGFALVLPILATIYCPKFFASKARSPLFENCEVTSIGLQHTPQSST